MKKMSHIMFWLVTVLGAVVFGAISISSNDIAFVINLAILLLIMVAVIIPYFGGYGKTNTLSTDFERAYKLLIDETNVNPEDFLNEFNNKNLKQCYQEYLYSINKYDDNSQNVSDIHDYINENFVDMITHKEVGEQVSGALTGLGILGTFIGLTFGLSGFDLTSNDISQMQDSISELMEGIKAAFYTSIFGVAFSIVSNFFMKRFYLETYEAMNKFLAEFENKVVSSPQEDIIKNFMSNHELQTELIQKMPDAIADAFSNQMQLTLNPVIEKLNSSIDIFMEKSVVSHNEGLGIIVNSFVDNLNSALGGQFEELGETLSQLNQSQIENNNKIQEVVNSVCDNAVELKNINDMLNGTVTRLEEYMSGLNSLQENIYNSNQSLIQQVSKLENIFEKQIESVNLFSRQEAALTTNILALTRLLGAYEKTAHELMQQNIKSDNNVKQTVENLFVELYSGFEELKKISKQQNTEFLASLEEITTDSRNVILDQTALTRRVLSEVVEQIEKAMSLVNNSSEEQNRQIIETFNTAIEQSSIILNTEIKKATEISEQMEINMKRSAQTLDAAYKELQNDITRVLKNTFDSFDEQLAQVAQHFSGTLKHSDDTITEMNKFMQSTPQKFNTIINKLISDLEKTVIELDRQKLSLDKKDNKSNN